MADVQRARRIHVAQHLTEKDEQARLQYYSPDLSGPSNIWFSDESHIRINGYVNRQTTRFLGFEGPDVVQKPVHSAWVTIWCAVSGHRIYRAYIYIFLNLFTANLQSVLKRQ